MVLYALACTLQMSVSVESSPLLLFSSLLGLVCPCRAIALCSVRNPIPPEAVTTTPSAFKLRNCTCWLRVDSSTDDFSWENRGKGLPFVLASYCSSHAWHCTPVLVCVCGDEPSKHTTWHLASLQSLNQGLFYVNGEEHF